MNTSPNFSLRPRVAVILSDPTLGTYLVENLLASFCEVDLFVWDIGYWKEKLSHLSENSNLNIYEKSFFGEKEIKYLIVSSDFFKTEKDLTFLTKINHNIGETTSVLTILPLASDSEVQKKISLQIFKNFNFVQNLKTIFLGDLFGPRMVLGENAYTEKIRQILIEGNVEVGSEQLYFPTFAPAASRQIVKSLFSFGVREGVFYYSHEIKESEIPIFFRRYFPSLAARGVTQVLGREFFNVKKRFLIETNLNEAYYETFRWFGTHTPEIKKVDRAKKPPKKEIKIDLKKIQFKTPKLPKINFKLPLAFFTVLMIPFLLLGVSVSLLGIGGSFLKKDNLRFANSFFRTAKAVNSLTSGVFLFYTKVPLFGHYFDSTYKLTRLVDKGADVASRGALLVENLNSVFENVLQKRDSDLNKTGGELSNLSGSLYVDLGFVQSESAEVGIYTKPIKTVLNKIEFEEIRSKLLLGEDLFKLLPEILGEEKAVTYMILFQNNTELRPTGGFIGSFALVTLDNGKLGGFEVYDVYDADGQLKGYVSPPEAIRRYLGEAAWYMRDANWDPDFPSSAAKIEWFLGKELGKSVDGVFGIDLSVAHSLISGLGSLYLTDFAKEITPNNFYLETQTAAEANFFPGSDKKRNFLTALSRALVFGITEKGITNKTVLVKNLLKDLDERHIQLSFNNQKVKELMGEAGLDGAINTPVCSSKNCQSDFLSIIDANVGVNKANYYIKKFVNLVVLEKQGVVEKRLKITYKNSAKRGSQNTYKNYLRIVVPLDSEISYVESEGVRRDFVVEDVSGRKEVGLLFEVPESEEKSIDFVWNQKMKIESGSEGEYQFLLRKQPGTNPDPVFASFNLLGGVGFESGLGSLTNEANFRYNTNLTRDILSRIKINK